jgi:hypothetical protein
MDSLNEKQGSPARIFRLQQENKFAEMKKSRNRILARIGAVYAVTLIIGLFLKDSEGATRIIGILLLGWPLVPFLIFWVMNAFDIGQTKKPIPTHKKTPG